MTDEGNIFEVREFCLHDGPGIRTTVFFKGCPLRCAWCHNPESISPLPQLLINRPRCTQCGACRKICVHPDGCVGCGACVAVCPQGCRRLCGQRVSAEALARELRKQESFFASYGGGITFSGGEPFVQAEPLCHLADAVHAAGKNVYAYSGYTCEELYSLAQKIPAVGRLLDKVDVLVDGPYVEALRDLELDFRGSSNQRVLDRAAIEALRPVEA